MRQLSDGQRGFQASRFESKFIVGVPTVVNQTQKDKLSKFYKGEKEEPLHLLPKKTRAMSLPNKRQENPKAKQQRLKEQRYPPPEYVWSRPECWCQ